MCQILLVHPWQPQMHATMHCRAIWDSDCLITWMLLCPSLLLVSIVFSQSSFISSWAWTCNLEACTDGGIGLPQWLKAIFIPPYCLFLLNFVATKLVCIYVVLGSGSMLGLCYMFATDTSACDRKSGYWLKFGDQELWLSSASKDTSRDVVEFTTKGSA